MQEVFFNLKMHTKLSNILGRNELIDLKERWYVGAWKKKGWITEKDE